MQENIELSNDEAVIHRTLSKNINKSISEIMADTSINIGKSKVTELLKSMIQKNLVIVEGSGRGTKYRIA